MFHKILATLLMCCVSISLLAMDPVKDIFKFEAEELCAICLDEKPTTITLPCEHRSLCEECAKALKQGPSKNCPICRKDFERIIEEKLFIVEQEKPILEIWPAVPGMNIAATQVVAQAAPPLPPRKKKTSSLTIIEKNDLEIGELIGKGSFGYVYKGLYKGQPVAIKKFFLKTLPGYLYSAFDPYVKAEMLGHPNIVSFLGISNAPGKFMMVSEMMPRSMRSFYLNPANKYNWQDMLTIMIGITEGLNFLHENQIAHKHLKSKNVFINDDFSVKIGDFDLSKIKLEASSSGCSPSEATVRWRAFETFTREYARSQELASRMYADILSLGLVFWELASKRVPYDGLSERGVVQMGTAKIPVIIDRSWPLWFQEILEQCFNLDPVSRPRASTLLAKLKLLKKIASLEKLPDSNDSQVFEAELEADLTFWQQPGAQASNAVSLEDKLLALDPRKPENCKIAMAMLEQASSPVSFNCIEKVLRNTATISVSGAQLEAKLNYLKLFVAYGIKHYPQPNFFDALGAALIMAAQNKIKIAELFEYEVVRKIPDNSKEAAFRLALNANCQELVDELLPLIGPVLVGRYLREMDPGTLAANMAVDNILKSDQDLLEFKDIGEFMVRVAFTSNKRYGEDQGQVREYKQKYMERFLELAITKHANNTDFGHWMGKAYASAAATGNLYMARLLANKVGSSIPEHVEKRWPQGFAAN